MIKTVFLCLICVLVGLSIGKYLLSDVIPDQTIEKIDTIYNDRQIYLRDTVYVQKKIIINHFDTIKTHIDSIFSGSDNEKKETFFDSVYSSKDTIKFIDISSDQAKQAIEVKNLWIRDSSLLDVCNKNVSECDGTLVKIKKETDSLKGIKALENHNFRNITYSLITGLILGFGFGTWLTK